MPLIHARPKPSGVGVGEGVGVGVLVGVVVGVGVSVAVDVGVAVGVGVGAQSTTKRAVQANESPASGLNLILIPMLVVTAGPIVVKPGSPNDCPGSTTVAPAAAKVPGKAGPGRLSGLLNGTVPLAPSTRPR